jgi:bifunctional UDP-N-acetylglucosamine pyrophosphorylase / glucosamine-1-phosphate N-acetyltransferase
MANTSIQAIVLAAGKSNRFQTSSSKLIAKICGQEMILYLTKLLSSMNIPTTIVVGFQSDEIKKVVSMHHKDEISFVHQGEQRGTGHATAQTQHTWYADNILILNGDTPLISQEIINELIIHHIKHSTTITFATAHYANPHSKYGRVIQHGDMLKIVEAKDCTADMHESCCINAGIYLIKKAFLHDYINKLSNTNAAEEYYITDLIAMANEHHFKVETISAPFDHIRGINTLKELWTVEQIKRSELMSSWMAKGVRFHMAQSTHIDIDVTIGSGTSIGAGVQLINGTTIGTDCIIEPFSIIDNSHIGNNVVIHSHCVIKNTTIEKECSVGPFAHLHDHSMMKEKAVVGNFVEIVRTMLNNESKAKHLSYLGDTNVGYKANIGAGTITCNYNGLTKHQTSIKDGAFIGSNSTIVAPVIIGKGAYTAAGSVITQHVPDDALAIARSRQTNKEGYAQKLRSTKKNEQKDDDHVSFIGATKTHNDITIAEE